MAQTNGLGVAGFIVSLVGMVLCFGLICPIGAILSGIALIWKPRGFAIAGLILGVLGSVLWGILLGFWVYKMPGYFTTNDLWMAHDEIDYYYSDNNDTLPDDATGQQLLSYCYDDWGTAYSYRLVDADNYEIISAGPDTQFGTTDDQVTPAQPNPYAYGSYHSHSLNRPTAEVLDDAHETIERTFENEYDSPPWHEVQNAISGNAGDEWGNDIRYNAGEGKEYELRSAGPDGLMNTDDDIVRSYTLGEDDDSGDAAGDAQDDAATGPGGLEQP